MIIRNLVVPLGKLSLLLLFLLPLNANSQESGEAIFNRICKACHTIGAGRLVGPDLQGVSDRHSIEWMVQFVQSSKAMVDAGDAEALKIFNEYNKIVMPDNPLSDGEALAVLTFITGIDARAAVNNGPATTNDFSDDELILGKLLFQGRNSFASGGPSCISCHNVNQSSIFAGGSLAKDLTNAVSRMTVAGVRAVLNAPPFPAMRQAYEGHSLQENEIRALTAFLQHTDQSPAASEKSWGLRLLLLGLAGTLILLLVYASIWSGRKQLSVNAAIHARQLRSE